LLLGKTFLEAVISTIRKHAHVLQAAFFWFGIVLHHGSSFGGCSLEFPSKSYPLVQTSTHEDESAIRAMNCLLDMLQGSFDAPATRKPNYDLVWCTNLAEAVALRGKAREAAAKQRMLEVEQAEKILLDAVHEGLDE
jgi:hypothetical protein